MNIKNIIPRLLLVAFLLLLASLACRAVMQPLEKIVAESTEGPGLGDPSTDEMTPGTSPTLYPTPPGAANTPALDNGSTWVNPKDGMVMVYVSAGEFLMGSTEADIDKVMALCSVCERGWFVVEQPQHTVTLEAYWIDQTEVTNGMYAQCVAAGTCEPPQEKKSETRSSYYDDKQYADFPVIYVDWNQANAYCGWVGRRLPSEAEWEKAARGTDGRMYPWGKKAVAGNLLNFADKNTNLPWSDQTIDDGYEDTAPVGSYPEGASVYGALDMAGNVYEWVADWYQVYPGGDVDASSEFGQTYRVARGGSWNGNGSYHVRTSFRFSYTPVGTLSRIGFRCALSP